jgi:sulfur-carrier protein adenylyltransferase/sulfurtransferase
VQGFLFSADPLDLADLRSTVEDPTCGGYVSFEGWVRDHNDGRSVARLEYEAFELLAVKEGQRIIAEAIERFGVTQARCVHRVGVLELGHVAVWVGVSSPHRGEAFAACRYIIDEVKHRVPIWKKEYYVDGDSGWVNCERCAAAALDATAPLSHDHSHHDHDHHHDSHDHGHSHPASAAIARHPDGLRSPDYSRQQILAEVGSLGQARIRGARVLVVGAGGLGVPVLSYLAGAGVGTLGIMDGDTLDASNLHRQTLYALDDVGQSKALLAAQRLRALNPEVDVRPYVERATDTNLAAIAAGYDVIVDCTDNFAARFAINDTAVRLAKPAVLASVYQYEGQLQVVRVGDPCLRCLWPDGTRDGIVGNCAEAGVLGPVPGVLGCLQALEVLKVILGMTSPAQGAVILIDLRTLDSRRIGAQRADDCPSHCSLTTDAHTVDLERSVTLPTAEWTVVDVREHTEVALAPLPGRSLHIPLGQLLDDPEQLPLGQRYLCVCARGKRALTAATALHRVGRDAASLAGGYSP